MNCLGCGNDMLASGDRRALDNPENSDARTVVEVWKSVLESEDVNLNSIQGILAPSCLTNTLNKTCHG